MSEADAQRVCISTFDESDPEQHTIKVLFGCGIYFGFRGRGEHHAIEKDHIGEGTFEEGHRFGGMPFVSVRVMNDKTNKITLHNPYLRDTGKLMRVPILNNDTNSSCFGGCLKRYVEKMNKAQRYLHCRAVLNDNRPNQIKKGNKGFYYDSCHLGQNKIASLFQKGAKLLGMSTKQFCPHSLRSLFITKMVNDKRVSNEESMKAARHSSVDAHLGYQELGKVSEGNRIQCLLDARPDKEKGPTTKTLSPESPNLVQLHTPASNSSSSSSCSQPGFATQVEWASFCAEKKSF